MEGDNKITINDVARAAGVSKGTVDRVLHNRGEVSARSKARVLEVIERLGFKPNVYASLLASRKVRRIVCLIPEYHPGEFWELTEKGIAAGKENAAKYGVTVEDVRYDQYDMESFQNACARTLEEDPVGVVLAPMFRNETLNFVKELSYRGIYYVYIDSKLEEDGYLAYFGMPMYQSGYLCADILTMGTPVPSVNIIRVARDKKGLSDPTLTRRTGFVDYITLSSSLLFSMKYATGLDALRKESFYNNVKLSDYEAEGYLDGLEVVSMDYKELVARYQGVPNVVYLVDPPYLSTEVGTYRMCWRLSDYLDVLTILHGKSYVYFTSNKSDILELCQWIGKNHWIGNPFDGAAKTEMRRTMNYQASYTDIMLYKKEIQTPFKQ